jgi:hypothetical protein
MHLRPALVLTLLAAPGPACADGKERPRAESGAAEAAGPVVTLGGTYEVDPVAQGKKFQGAWLLPEGGKERLVLSYRPEPKYFAFIGKRVVVTGRHRVLPPYVQQIGADHFDLHSIALAKGEAPYAEVPKQIPAPPLADSKEKLAALSGRWARVYGRVLTLEVSPEESRYVLKLAVAMPDGHVLSVKDLYLGNMRWDKAKKVDAITLIGRAGQVRTDGGMVPDIDFAAVCQGHVERCGMDR